MIRRLKQLKKCFEILNNPQLQHQPKTFRNLNNSPTRNRLFSSLSCVGFSYLKLSCLSKSLQYLNAGKSSVANTVNFYNII